MEKIVRESLLFDFYGELLTEHQKKIYEDIINDMTYSEIADDENISRQAVFDLVKRANRQLETYESKLNLVKKFLSAEEKMKQLTADIEELRNNYVNDDFNLKAVEDENTKESKLILDRNLMKICNMSRQIFDEF